MYVYIEDIKKVNWARYDMVIWVMACAIRAEGVERITIRILPHRANTHVFILDISHLVHVHSFIHIRNTDYVNAEQRTFSTLVYTMSWAACRSPCMCIHRRYINIRFACYFHQHHDDIISILLLSINIYITVITWLIVSKDHRQLKEKF